MKKLTYLMLFYYLSFIVARPGWAFEAHQMMRLGSSYGGWSIPDGILSEESICYCAGAGEDVSFDVGLVDTYGSSVYIFDPTPRSIAHVHNVKEALAHGKEVLTVGPNKIPYKLDPSFLNRLYFEPVGLWNQDTNLIFYFPKNPEHVSCSALNLQGTLDSFEAPVKKLAILMRSLGHQNLDLLKMDIEGAEFVVLESMLQEKIFPRILCVEFHATNQFDKGSAIESLKKVGYRQFYVNGTTDYTFLLELHE